jgi:hypothetical protein
MINGAFRVKGTALQDAVLAIALSCGPVVASGFVGIQSLLRSLEAEKHLVAVGGSP